MVQFWTSILTSPIILISALLIGTMGEAIKRGVNSKQIECDVVAYRDNTKHLKAPAAWKQIFYFTLPAQPVLVGIALGFIPWLPAVDGLSKTGYDLAAHVGTYSLAGVVCKVGYDVIISTLKRLVSRGLQSTLTPTPAVPPVVVPPADPTVPVAEADSPVPSVEANPSVTPADNENV
jgi:hypothetical protein